jgi:nucleoside-diphosphate-sugar epimerase
VTDVTKHLIVGFGYLGSEVGKLWRTAGEIPSVITRNASRSAGLREAGYDAIVADVTDPPTLGNLAAVDSLLYAVGFDRTAGNDIHTVYADGLRNVLAALPPTVKRVIYISTTGVYGSAGGEWVDEQTPPDPRREGGRASLAAEQILAAHPLGKHSAILRLAGIYGPGRIPHLDKLRAGEPLPVPQDGWLNLIHVDDAARIVVAAEAWLAELATASDAAPNGPHIFCVADGSPVRRDDYYREAARVLGAPPPQFVAPPPDSAAAARAGANRRIDNVKMRQTFSVDLNFPSYREGLASVLATES